MTIVIFMIWYYHENDREFNRMSLALEPLFFLQHLLYQGLNGTALTA